MPKIAHGTGATADGLGGIVDDAEGQLWELDPERERDGALKDGEHPDRDERETVEPAGPDDEPHLQRDEVVSEEEPSPGDNSSTSGAKTAASPSKSNKTAH